MLRPCLAAVGAALLAFPAAASAATFTVDPAANAGCDANRTCRTIGQALSDTRLADGDTVTVKKGSYSEPALAIGKANVVLQAETPGTVAIASTVADGTAALTLGGAGDTVKGLIIGTAKEGGPVVRVTAANTTMDTTVLGRLEQTSRDAPAVDIVDASVNGGTTTISSSYVLNAPKNTGEQSAAAISGTPDSSVALVQSVVLSGGNQGSALSIPGGGTANSQPLTNRIVRSTLFGGKQGANGIDAQTTGVNEKRILIDSSIVTPGQNGSALFVTTPDDNPSVGAAPAGAVNITAVQSTFAGAGRPFDLRGINSAGNVNATFDRSIVRGSLPPNVQNYEGGDLVVGIPPSQTAATKSGATITSSDTNVAPKTGNAYITLASTSNTADDKLFLSPGTRDFHLRPDAVAAIDKAGGQPAGFSDKDVDGEPRVNGGGADLGGDEYTNKPPLARLKVSTNQPKQGEAVTFTAEAADPEQNAGGGLVRYVWDFGDGSTAETTEPTTTHAYSALGAVQAKVTVIDKQGGQTTTAPQALDVKDGTPPLVVLAAPKGGKTYNLYKVTRRKVARRDGKGRVLKDKKGRTRYRTVTTRKARKIAIKGTATDDSGIAKVELLIRRVGGSTAQCTYFDGKGSFLVKSCKKPTFFPIRIKDGAFAYNLKATSKIKKAEYEVAVRATDGNGVVSTPVSATITLK